jgi:hypothetical protein
MRDLGHPATVTKLGRRFALCGNDPRSQMRDLGHPAVLESLFALRAKVFPHLKSEMWGTRLFVQV